MIQGADVWSQGIALSGEDIVPLPEATVPLSDRGFAFGAALFETVLVHDGHPIAWPRHRDRLQSSLQCLGWSGLSPETVDRKVALLARGCLQRARGSWALKVFVTEGVGGSFDAHCDHLIPALYVSAQPVHDTYLLSLNTTAPKLAGVRLLPVPDRRALGVLLHKTTSYFVSRLALVEARNRGYDDAVFHGKAGGLSESTTASLVWLDDRGQLCIVDADKELFLPSTVICRLESLLQSLGTGLVRCQLMLDDVGTTVKAAAVLSSVRGARPVLAMGKDLAEPHESARLANWLNGLLAAEAQKECANSLL